MSCHRYTYCSAINVSFGNFVRDQVQSSGSLSKILFRKRCRPSNTGMTIAHNLLQDPSFRFSSCQQYEFRWFFLVKNVVGIISCCFRVSLLINYTVFDVNWKMHKLKTQRWYLSFALRNVWNFPIHRSALGNHWSQRPDASSNHQFKNPKSIVLMGHVFVSFVSLWVWEKSRGYRSNGFVFNLYGSRFLAIHAQHPRRIALSVFHMGGIRLIEPKCNMCSKFQQQSERTWVTVNRRVTLTL